MKKLLLISLLAALSPTYGQNRAVMANADGDVVTPWEPLWWNDIQAKLGVTAGPGRHGIMARTTTAAGGVAIIGESQSGAAAGKFVQDGWDGNPSPVVWISRKNDSFSTSPLLWLRAGTTDPSVPILRIDSPDGVKLFSVNADGSFSSSATNGGGDLTVTGNTVLGDAMGDTLTINAGTIIAPALDARYAMGGAAAAPLPELLSAFALMLPDYMTLPLPQGLAVSVDLPMTNDATNPPPNQAYNPTPALIAQGGPLIQSTVKRSGKSYSGYTPLGARWIFGMPAAWNDLGNCSFAIQAWVYLPANQLNTDYEWQQNIIYGGGGPSSGCPRFGVQVINGAPRLCMFGVGIVSSAAAFPLDAWVHVAVTYDLATTSTTIFLNGFPVGSSSTNTYVNSGASLQYNLGSAEYNGPWAMWWRGYICNFRLYK